MMDPEQKQKYEAPKDLLDQIRCNGHKKDEEAYAAYAQKLIC